LAFPLSFHDHVAVLVKNEGVRWNTVHEEDIAADRGVCADDGFAANDSGVGVDRDVVFESGVAAGAAEVLATGEGTGDESDALIHFDMGTDHGGFAHHGTGAVIDEEVGADGGAWVEVHAASGMGPLGHDAWQEGDAGEVELVGHALDGNGFHERVGHDHLFGAQGGGIASEGGFGIGLEDFSDAGEAGKEIEAQLAGGGGELISWEVSWGGVFEAFENLVFQTFVDGGEEQRGFDLQFRGDQGAFSEETGEDEAQEVLGDRGDGGLGRKIGTIDVIDPAHRGVRGQEPVRQLGHGRVHGGHYPPGLLGDASGGLGWGRGGYSRAGAGVRLGGGNVRFVNAKANDVGGAAAAAWTRPIRAGSVPYLNAAPLVRGLEGRLRLLPPSQLAVELRKGTLDAGLVSITETLLHDAYDILDGYGVASDGEVYSVFLAHRGPLEAVRRVRCDTASLTSVNLLRVLLAERGLRPEFEPLTSVEGAGREEAVLLIGDGAIAFRQAGHPHTIWDLGEAWRAWTGLPFVYAVWALRRGVDTAGLRRELAEAGERGQREMDAVVREARGFDEAFRRIYLTRHTHHTLGAMEKEGVARFVALLRRHRTEPVYDPRYVGV